MNTTEIIHLLNKINELIQSEKSLTPIDFCNKLAISERQFYEYINMMKKLGAPVRFDRKLKRYVYTKPGSLSIAFQRTSEINTYKHEMEGCD